MKNPIIDDLHSQYLATLDMLALAVEHCPNEFWNRPFGDDSPFWKEAYHMLHYFVKYAHGIGDAVHVPFEQYMDPTLVNKPQAHLTREEIRSYIDQTRCHFDDLFAGLTQQDLLAEDAYAPQRFASVFHRLVYGLRHGQHHVGKLTGYLFCNGIDYDPWR